jgi:hypothetical protein
LSVQRLLNALRDEGWSIVLVMNESPDLERVFGQWADVADVVIRRPNIGRDFGAYQAGYSFLRKRSEYSQIKKLGFFNDSVLYPPKISSILPELLEKDAPIAGFFLNNQFHVHMQSFALILGAQVVHTSEIASFWSSYFPSNIRRHAIHKGEVRLSQFVLKRWEEADVVVSHSRLLDSRPNVLGQLLLFETSVLRARVAGEPRLSNASVQRRAGREMAYLDLLVREAFSGHNVSHVLGTFVSRTLGAPLKLDLLRHGINTPADFRETLKDILLDDSELEEIMRMVLSKGTLASISTFEWYRIRFGFSG